LNNKYFPSFVVSSSGLIFIGFPLIASLQTELPEYMAQKRIQTAAETQRVLINEKKKTSNAEPPPPNDLTILDYKLSSSPPKIAKSILKRYQNAESIPVKDEDGACIGEITKGKFKFRSKCDK
jgi:hypothetical protein